MALTHILVSPVFSLVCLIKSIVAKEEELVHHTTGPRAPSAFDKFIRQESAGSHFRQKQAISLFSISSLVEDVLISDIRRSIMKT